MEVLTKTELTIRKQEIIKRIKDGEVFIHPTDTIYGLGCDARNEAAVTKIIELKGRNPKQHLSILVTGKRWIERNCEVTQKALEAIEQLPGQITIILKLNDENMLADALKAADGTIGVRIPKHWMSKFVQELGFPIVTTSANKSGQEFMTSVDNLDRSIEQGVSFALYEGEKTGRPSKIINTLKDEVRER